MNYNDHNEGVLINPAVGGNTVCSVGNLSDNEDEESSEELLSTNNNNAQRNNNKMNNEESKGQYSSEDLFDESIMSKNSDEISMMEEDDNPDDPMKTSISELPCSDSDSASESSSSSEASYQQPSGSNQMDERNENLQDENVRLRSQVEKLNQEIVCLQSIHQRKLTYLLSEYERLENENKKLKKDLEDMSNNLANTSSSSVSTSGNPNSNESKWQNRFQELVKFKQEHGHLRVPQTESLGQWLNNQKAQYKWLKEDKKSSITPKRIEQLESIEGFEWSSARRGNWEDKFKELVAFKKANGHMKIPQGTSLGNWIANQKSNYTNFKDGKKTSMTPERIAALESIGFEWKSQKGSRGSMNWDDKYKELVEFQKTNGHLKVPQGTSLSNWISNQRSQYKSFKENKYSPMTNERIASLEAVKSFEWGGNRKKSNSNWEEKFQELVEFKEKHGHAIVPQSYGSLGNWVSNQRAQYKLLKANKQPCSMTPERVKLLVSVGFVWSLREHNKSANSPMKKNMTPPQTPLTSPIQHRLMISSQIPVIHTPTSSKSTKEIIHTHTAAPLHSSHGVALQLPTPSQTTHGMIHAQLPTPPQQRIIPVQLLTSSQPTQKQSPTTLQPTHGIATNSLIPPQPTQGTIIIQGPTPIQPIQEKTAMVAIEQPTSSPPPPPPSHPAIVAQETASNQIIVQNLCSSKSD